MIVHCIIFLGSDEGAVFGSLITDASGRKPSGLLQIQFLSEFTPPVGRSYKLLTL